MTSTKEILSRLEEAAEDPIQAGDPTLYREAHDEILRYVALLERAYTALEESSAEIVALKSKLEFIGSVATSDGHVIAVDLSRRPRDPSPDDLGDFESFLRNLVKSAAADRPPVHSGDACTDPACPDHMPGFHHAHSGRTPGNPTDQSVPEAYDLHIDPVSYNPAPHGDGSYPSIEPPFFPPRKIRDNPQA